KARGAAPTAQQRRAPGEVGFGGRADRRAPERDCRARPALRAGGGQGSRESDGRVARGEAFSGASAGRAGSGDLEEGAEGEGRVGPIRLEEGRSALRLP